MSSRAELPGGTVTFLFTDIEGSTRLLKQLRERYAKALPRARLEVVEGAGHFVEMEKPTELGELVTAFVSQGDA